MDDPAGHGSDGGGALRAAAEALGRSFAADEHPEVVSAEQLYEVCDLDSALVWFRETAVREVADANGLAEHELLGWLAHPRHAGDGERRGTGVAGMPAEVAYALVDQHVLATARALRDAGQLWAGRGAHGGPGNGGRAGGARPHQSPDG